MLSKKPKRDSVLNLYISNSLLDPQRKDKRYIIAVMGFFNSLLYYTGVERGTLLLPLFRAVREWNELPVHAAEAGSWDILKRQSQLVAASP